MCNACMHLVQHTPAREHRRSLVLLFMLLTNGSQSHSQQKLEAH